MCSSEIPRRPWRRVPTRTREFYELPRSVGVVQAGNHEPLQENAPITRHFTIRELYDELEMHDINAVSIYTKQIPWLYWNPEYSDYSQGWSHPYVDVIIVRPSSMAWTYYEEGCDGKLRDVWSDYPIEQYAEFLYDMYRHLDKVIIFTDWEIDHLLGGIGCDCENEQSEAYEVFVRREIKRKSRAVKAVRDRYPNSKLRVMYGPTVNALPCNNSCESRITASELIGQLQGLDKPDYVLVSAWCGDSPITESLEWVSKTTGFRPYRMVVAEIGARRENGQYDKIYDLVEEAWEFGINAVFVWTWKETWCNENGRGLWEIVEPCEGKVEWGVPAPGYYAVQDLNRRKK